MSSDQETTKLQADSDGDKEDVIASVRLKADTEKMIRRAAVEVDQSRSDFMAEASEERARRVLGSIEAQRASA